VLAHAEVVVLTYIVELAADTYIFIEFVVSLTTIKGVSDSGWFKKLNETTLYDVHVEIVLYGWTVPLKNHIFPILINVAFINTILEP
jgi:hypothetical protein